MSRQKTVSYLSSKGIDLKLKGHNSYTLEATGFMKLTVETWYTDDILNISMCHYGEQNGDLMKDPDILMQYNYDAEKLTFIEFQNDYTGTYQDKDSNPNLQNELEDFMKMWIENLKSQGHKLTEKEIDV